MTRYIIKDLFLRCCLVVGSTIYNTGNKFIFAESPCINLSVPQLGDHCSGCRNPKVSNIKQNSAKSPMLVYPVHCGCRPVQFLVFRRGPTIRSKTVIEGAIAYRILHLLYVEKIHKLIKIKKIQ